MCFKFFSSTDDGLKKFGCSHRGMTSGTTPDRNSMVSSGSSCGGLEITSNRSRPQQHFQETQRLGPHLTPKTQRRLFEAMHGQGSSSRCGCSHSGSSRDSASSFGTISTNLSSASQSNAHENYDVPRSLNKVVSMDVAKFWVQ